VPAAAAAPPPAAAAQGVTFLSDSKVVPLALFRGVVAAHKDTGFSLASLFDAGVAAAAAEPPAPAPAPAAPAPAAPVAPAAPAPAAPAPAKRARAPAPPPAPAPAPPTAAEAAAAAAAFLRAAGKTFVTRAAPPPLDARTREMLKGDFKRLAKRAKAPRAAW
jgi:hypothetical protein